MMDGISVSGTSPALLPAEQYLKSVQVKSYKALEMKAVDGKVEEQKSEESESERKEKNSYFKVPIQDQPANSPADGNEVSSSYVSSPPEMANAAE